MLSCFLGALGCILDGLATFSLRSGRSRSNLLCSLRFISNSAGIHLVVLCGVVQQLSKNGIIFSFWVPGSPLAAFIDRLKVFTALSASLLKAGWYGALNMCFILLLLRKSLNSCAKKLSSITSNQLFWKTMCSEHGAQGVFGYFSSCTAHAQHLQPFRLSIDDYQERSTLEWTTVAQMQSLPRTVWPYPNVVSSNWCFAMRGLTNLTARHQLFYVILQCWPPNMQVC